MEHNARHFVHSFTMEGEVTGKRVCDEQAFVFVAVKERFIPSASRSVCSTSLACCQCSDPVRTVHSVDKVILTVATYLCFSWKTRTMGRRSMPAVFASTWPPTKHSLRTSPAHSSLWSARRPPDHWCTVHRPYCRILCSRFQGGCSSLIVCHATWCNSGLGCCACHMHSVMVPLV